MDTSRDFSEFHTRPATLGSWPLRIALRRSHLYVAQALLRPGIAVQARLHFHAVREPLNCNNVDIGQTHRQSASPTAKGGETLYWSRAPADSPYWLPTRSPLLLHQNKGRAVRRFVLRGRLRLAASRLGSAATPSHGRPCHTRYPPRRVSSHISGACPRSCGVECLFAPCRRRSN